jgi:hypothetical protein
LADVEGFPEIGGLFRDTAEGEASHAQGHLDELRKVGDPATGMPIGATRSTLEAAILYPPRRRWAHAPVAPRGSSPCSFKSWRTDSGTRAGIIVNQPHTASMRG